jgi:hypothetical protein
MVDVLEVFLDLGGEPVLPNRGQGRPIDLE